MCPESTILDTPETYTEKWGRWGSEGDWRAESTMSQCRHHIAIRDRENGHERLKRGIVCASLSSFSRRANLFFSPGTQNMFPEQVGSRTDT